MPNWELLLNGRPTDTRILAALQLINTEYEQSSVRIADLAKAVNLSVSRFSHLFTAEVGTSPARYLRSVRIEAATGFLVNSFLSVKQVAIMVGLSNHASFDRAYKRSTGQTPTAVRSSWKGTPKAQAARIEIAENAI